MRYNSFLLTHRLRALNYFSWLCYNIKMDNMEKLTYVHKICNSIILKVNYVLLDHCCLYHNYTTIMIMMETLMVDIATGEAIINDER